MTFRCLLGGYLLVCSLAHAQVNSTPKPCTSPNDVIPKGASYYSTGNPCLFNYTVPQARQGRLLRENPQCRAYGPVTVNCSSAATGNYGQVRTGLGAPSVSAQGPTRPDGNGRPVVYPETTLATMHFLPSRTSEEIWQMAENFSRQGHPLKSAAAFLRCSEMGNVRCTSALGQLYDQGKGVPLDRIRAVWYLTRAANGGNRGAQYELGVYWEEGEVLPQDFKKALEWTMKSAQQDFPNAERRIGLAYEFGELTLPRSRPKAIEWLSKSAAQGDGLSAEVIRILRSPNTPARFRDMDAFGAYYQSLFQAQWAVRSVPAGGFNGGAYNHNVAVNAYYAAGNPAAAATCAATPSCRH
jgi:TPR repeat protein